jgi:hypothetical protein
MTEVIDYKNRRLSHIQRTETTKDIKTVCALYTLGKRDIGQPKERWRD